MQACKRAGRYLNSDILRFFLSDYCSHSAKKRRAANNYTLRDAQKLQKTQFRAVKLGIFVQNAHKNTSRDITV